MKTTEEKILEEFDEMFSDLFKHSSGKLYGTKNGGLSNVYYEKCNYAVKSFISQALQRQRSELVEMVLHNIKTEIGWGKIGFTHKKTMEEAVYLKDIERNLEEIANLITNK